METKLSDVQELALKIDLDWVKDFNKAVFFDDDGKLGGLRVKALGSLLPTSATIMMAGAANGTWISDVQLKCCLKCDCWKNN